MVVRQVVKEPEGVVLPVARIEYQNLVLAGVIVVLVEREELVHSQVRIHRSDSVEEYIRPPVIILDGDVIHYPLVDILDEFRTVRITDKSLLGVLRSGRILFFLLKEVLQHGRMLEKLLLVKEIAELLKKVQRKHIDVVDGADKIRLELLDLPSDVVLLLGRVLIDEEVIEQVTVLSVLEAGAVELIV